VLAEHCADYFELDVESPYMLLVAPVHRRRWLDMPVAVDETDDALVIVDQPRSDIPAVTHVDYSARVQTVDAERSPDLRKVLEAFHAETGCPVLVNTSFNVRGEPIVCTPRDAYRCFMMTDMDMLLLEDRILLKAEQPPFPEKPSDEDPEAEIAMFPVNDGHGKGDPASPLALAGALFDDLVASLAERRRDDSVASFPVAPDPAISSYFDMPMPHSMGPGLHYPGAGASGGLIDTLIAYWEQRGDHDLAALGPPLKQFALAHEATARRSDGKVDIFVYTMF
jgi:hypothetical protein